MKLGFFYHSIAYQAEGQVYLPGYIGVFIDELARNCEQLHLFFQTSRRKNSDQDYQLCEQAITFHDLGNETPAWERDINHKKYIDKIIHVDLDCLIVRSPSPLAPYFKHVVKENRLVYMVVGDYGEGRKSMKIKSMRDFAVWLYLGRNQRRFLKALKGSKVVVNSPVLYQKFIELASSVHLVKTTTLNKDSFVSSSIKPFSETIKLLYTGRFDWAKGLKELALATVALNRAFTNRRFELHVAGWQTDGKDDVIKGLSQIFTNSHMQDLFINHGKIKIGKELNLVYFSADIYVLPSYHEGFPRTIWEAMAQNLPVITTKVGAIPYYLENEKHALLIEPKSVDEILSAVVNLLENPELHVKLINSGRNLAMENTLEVQTKKLIQAIHE
ncbi:MAG: glycosyltransferase family 4 protein [Parachlamydiaceae bacterium]|nr:glycosyltransferase family 4 protein [Parachlamydiaceae bacterium]